MNFVRTSLWLLGIIGICAPIAYGLTINANIFASVNFSVTGAISKGSGTFVIDHPLNPKNMLLYHSFVESPDALNVYRGITRFDPKGEARVTLPAYFEALNKNVTYQFTPLKVAMPNLHIMQPLADNEFTIGGGISGESVSWMVTGVRHDRFIEAYPINVEVDKGPHALLEIGECVYSPLCE